ncbi:MAG: 3-deoxy-8-phosphooctulonate synthase [Verrucomicrobia bacterium GWF2_51_19]|nr:MAG: 3-deoxy-8-phosphooctulonate synthase [Verrucomicrobia bacterium GWF2_51_19]HCJ12295.1 3-deoxy-8-phosphooctulonate synthase [Opitutae bacterium]
MKNNLIYNANKLLFIAGPCSLENESISFTVAEKIADLQKKHVDIQFIFKGSFDKANRMSVSGKRGPGEEEGLKILEKIRMKYGLPVLTDVHLPDQVPAIAEVCDVLQIPAFLCRQTDLLVAAAQSGRAVNVKKGQFLSPNEMQFIVERLRASGAKEIWQTERGTTFGYNRLIVDMRSFSIMAENDAPTVFDATHSVQLPGAGGGKSSGERQYVLPLAKAALAAGANGLFIETHPCPEKAISDADSQIPLKEFPALVESVLAVWKTA